MSRLGTEIHDSCVVVLLTGGSDCLICVSDNHDRACSNALYTMYHMQEHSSFLLYNALYDHQLLPKRNEGQLGDQVLNNMDVASESKLLTEVFQRYSHELDSLIVPRPLYWPRCRTPYRSPTSSASCADVPYRHPLFCTV